MATDRFYFQTNTSSINTLASNSTIPNITFPSNKSLAEETTTFLAAMEGGLTNLTNGSNTHFVPVNRPVIPLTIYVFYVLFIITGISTNIVNMVVLRRFKKYIFTVYLKALTVCDFLFCISLASNMVLLVKGYFSSYWYNAFNLYFWVLIMHISPGASLWVTVATAVDRLFHVISPARAQARMSSYRARIAVFLVILISVIGRLPYVFL